MHGSLSLFIKDPNSLKRSKKISIFKENEHVWFFYQILIITATPNRKMIPPQNDPTAKRIKDTAN